MKSEREFLHKLPHGLWPVMLTAFREDGSIDWAAVDMLTDWYVENGSAGLFACCLSSEMYELSMPERMALIKRVVRRVAGRIPVVASATFSNKTTEQKESMSMIADCGVNALVIISCHLAGPGESDGILLERMAGLAEAIKGIDLGVY